MANADQRPTQCAWLSRRDFLKLSGAAALSLALSPSDDRPPPVTCDAQHVSELAPIDLPEGQSLPVTPTHDIRISLFNDLLDTAFSNVVGLGSNQQIQTHRLLDRLGVGGLTTLPDQFDDLLRVPAGGESVGVGPKPSFAPFDAVVYEHMKGSNTFPLLAVSFSPDNSRLFAAVRVPYVFDACDYGLLLDATERTAEEKILSVTPDHMWTRARSGGMLGFLSINTDVLDAHPDQTSVSIRSHTEDRSTVDDASPSLLPGFLDRLAPWNGFPRLMKTTGGVDTHVPCYVPEDYYFDSTLGQYVLRTGTSAKRIRGDIDGTLEAIITATQPEPLAVLRLKNWAAVDELDLDRNDPSIVLPISNLEAYTPWMAFTRAIIGQFLPIFGGGALLGGLTAPSWGPRVLRTIWERTTQKS